MSSIRHFTSEQFSDGTTIDGDRLERSLQDLEDYINNIPDGDFKNRWLQSQIVLKYLPWTAEADAQFITDGAPAGSFMPFPYLPVYNYGAENLMNAFRVKGNRLDYQDAFTTTGLYGAHAVAGARQVAWTTCFSVGEDPAILDSVDAVLASYTTEYTNTYEYQDEDPGLPENRTDGQSVNDIHLEITVDSTFIPNVQIENTVLYHKYNFDASSYMIKAAGLPPVTAFSSDMSPSLNTGDLVGMGIGYDTTLHIKDSNLRIPIPPFSRVRFALILPDSGQLPWGVKPWQTMIPTLTLTLLERLKDG